MITPETMITPTEIFMASLASDKFYQKHTAMAEALMMDSWIRESIDIYLEVKE